MPPDEGDDLVATRVLSGRNEILSQGFRVLVTGGPDRGAECVSEDGELAIGTALGNRLVLTDPTVSRHHCVIAATPRGFLLRDLGSTNGTQLGGFRTEAAYLKSGAVVAIGESTVRFERTGEAVSERLSEEERFGRLLGRSPAMRRIFAALPRIAASPSSVLIEGETGTGKGLLAEAIHQASARDKGPFVVVDCSAIPPTLIESELFGHERGAFTGAHTARTGAFEAARGGTLFLDEIGELPLDMQPKLLRALEERTVKRVGGSTPVRLDVRVIAATNRDLRQEVNRNAFRSDLYYRLNTIRLHVPPLRERREDIPFLAAHFHAQFSGGDPHPPPELVTALEHGDWPGNVRELRNAVERAVMMEDPALWADLGIGAPPPGSGQADRGQADGAPPDFAPGEEPEIVDPEVPFRAAKEQILSRWERRYVSELIRKASGNLTHAARLARMDRNYLRELLHKHRVPIRDD